jgi:hypothetical protein
VQSAQFGERRKRNQHLVADAAYVDKNLIWALVDELAAEQSNHVQRLLISAASVSNP